MATDILCSVVDCGNPSKKAGMCFAHYERKRRHGSPTSGGPMQGPKGSAAAYLRDVVLKYNSRDCLYWPFGRSNGYAVIKQGGVSRKAYRIVCETINGPPPTSRHQAAHNCGKGSLGCINPNHLEWKTPADNQADRLIHGTDIRGEKNVRSKLTAENVLAIRANDDGHTRRELANIYGVSQRCIYNVQEGKTWRSV